MSKEPKFHCTSEAQKRAIKASYARKSRANIDKPAAVPLTVAHPRFPFWARLRIGKHRPTLVIDEEYRLNKRKGKDEDGFVHREVQHPDKKGALVITPNPDPSDPSPMILKKATWLPKYLFDLEKGFNMPEDLVKMYEKNNDK